MKNDLINGFCWREEKPGDSVLKDEEKYKAAVDWAFPVSYTHLLPQAKSS